ncbi:MAG: hypothetical protein MJY68_06865 [Bacteroidaceae bacterium]|nr:hypothetical protein [Bacteroidaceae bacterium]
MKQIRFFSMLFLSVLMGAVTLTSCGSSGTATKKEKKTIVLQEGDKATLTVDETFTTISLPETMTADEMAMYETDIMGYLSKSNAPITTDGGTWDSYRIYYYMHNSKEWLHQGIYSTPQEIQMSRVKSIRIANERMRLREFADEMPLLSNSKEMKSDQSFQDEISFGNTYYIFIDITLKDQR